MGLLDKIAGALGGEGGGGRKDFSEPPFWALDAARYTLYGSYSSTRERIENDFESYVAGAFKGNGIVFSCIDRRQQVFSQARFAWRSFKDGRPGDLFGSTELSLLENPWPNGTTGELLTMMEQDASLAGQFYATTVDEAGRIGRNATGKGRRIARMRPDWVTLVIDAPSGNPFNVDARVVAFQYEPRGFDGHTDPLLLLPEEVCHYSPIPDPVARFRGMSWLTPVIKETMADRAATLHKLKYFENGATPGLAITGIPAASKEQFNDLVDMMEARHKGAANAYKSLYLAAGADAKAVGADLKQLDFKVTQGAGETRLATAAGVPAAILGISEGLQGSSLNAGNFGAARRLFVDTTIRSLWGKAAPSLQRLLTPPGLDASLWYDARDIPFLREDAKDDAEIRTQDARSIRELLDGGFEPDAAVEFVRTGDLNVLMGRHSGLYSVQLQEPGSGQGEDVNGTPSTNGRVNGAQASLPR